MAARWAISAPAAIWITPSPSAHWSSAVMSTVTRPAPASSPTACRKPSTKRCWPRARPWCARSSSPRRGCEAAPAADRQLRLLHLQPGAGVPDPRRGGERLPQRRAHPAAGAGARTLAPVHLARPRDAVRRGRIHGHDPRVRRSHPGARRMPRTPGHRGSVRGQGRAGRSLDARQDLARTSRSAHVVRGSAAAVRSGALPFADRRSRDHASGARGERADRARGDHGGAPPFAGGGGRAVSSRKHPDARRSAAVGQFPEGTARGGAETKPHPEPAMPLPRELLQQLLERRDLSQAQAEELLAHLTDPLLPPAMAGAMLAALSTKGVVADEVRGFAQAMRRLARRPDFAANLRAVDIVGTGGDASGSYNLY